MEMKSSLGPKIGDEDRETSSLSSKGLGHKFDVDNFEISRNQTGQGTKIWNSKLILTTSLSHQKIAKMDKNLDQKNARTTSSVTNRGG